MIEIIVGGDKLYKESTNEFIDLPKTKIQLEHSLISIHKWEMKYHRPFLKSDKTQEEVIEYLKCMTITKNVNPLLYQHIPNSELNRILEYIKDEHSATTFYNDGLIGAAKTKNEVITAEIIYYWMISLSIPVEFEKWHLETLLKLIKVVTVKNQPKKKIDQRAWAMERARINAERRKMWNSKG